MVDCSIRHTHKNSNMSESKTSKTRSDGAYYMRQRDAYVVYIFQSERRQSVESSHIIRNWAEFIETFPGSFKNVRGLHRFVAQTRTRRKRRNTIADRMSVEICRFKQPVWKARSKSRSVSPVREVDPGSDEDKKNDTK